MGIHDKTLRALDHRLVWWLLSNQAKDDAGTPTGTVPDGWRVRALAELETHRPQLWAAEKRLRDAGVIKSRKHQRGLRIDGSAFV